MVFIKMTISFANRSVRLLFSLLLLLCVSEIYAAEEISCVRPIAIKDTAAFFERLALLQLKLEFGDGPIEITRIKPMKVGPNLTRVDGFAMFRKPGRTDSSTQRITGWVEHCQGVVIINENTWLADGTLVVPRYTQEQLPGRGLALGSRDAPLKLIAYVDSRCPHCHRLVGYAIQLAKAGKMYIEIRQTAFLESAQEAIKDTLLPETSLIRPIGSAIVSVNDADYLEMLAGLSNDDELPETTTGYQEALDLVNQNTESARNVVNISNVPALLVLDARQGQYRLTSYWEMNRLLQPDL